MGLSYSSNNADAQSQSQSHSLLGSGTQAILPPTLPPTAPDDNASDTDTIGTAGPRPSIAVAPLTQDSAQLAALGSAAARENAKGNHLVLLVLTPVPADAAAIGTIATQTHAAAEAALHAITAAGVPADRVEISSATALAGAPGEIRLYVR